MTTPEVTVTWDAEAEVFVSEVPALGVLSSGLTEHEARAAVFSAASLGFRYLCDQAMSNGEHTTYLRMAAELDAALEDKKRLTEALINMRDGCNTPELHCIPVPMQSDWRYVIDTELKDKP